jgi:hypothetical protein
MMKKIALALALAVPFAGSAVEPGAWNVPGTDTTIKLYGFIQFDSTYDLDGRQEDINGIDWASFLPTQPLDDSTVDEARGRQFYATARTSRLGLQTKTPTDLGALSLRLEADFNSPSPYGYSTELTTNGVTFRVRHAYGQLGGLLVGQTWSTFLDLGSIPDTVDFNPGGAFALTRQPMVRYTFDRGPLSFSVAAENSRGMVSLGGTEAAPVDAADSVPDFIAGVNYTGTFGHVSLRGVTHRYETNDDVAQAFGAGLAGSFKLLKTDTLVWSVQGGPGIGRYLWNALLQGAENVDGEIKLWNAYAYHVGLTHQWNPKFRSNVVWTQTFFEKDDELAAVSQLANERIDQGFVNTFWGVTKNVEVGVEYAYGRRYTFADEKGTQHRLNANVHYNFY